jgi:hypothetical protein
LTQEIVKDDSLSNVVSSILSDKYRDVGQIKRIDFAKFLESKGIKLDVYGQGSEKFLFKEHKGKLPYHNKNAGLLPYKYTFNAENTSIKNYLTEKLFDGILAECLVFYNGCFNAKEFFPNGDKAFVYLNLINFEKDYEIIKSAIENNLWEERLPYIKEAKQHILNNMQFFPRLEKIVNDDLNKYL